MMWWQIDIFAVEAVWLGKLHCCVVSRDADTGSQGWYCEQILAREGPSATHEYVFLCHRYVAQWKMYGVTCCIKGGVLSFVT